MNERDIRILVVEDERLHRRLLVEVLSEEGYEVSGFDNAEKAWAYILRDQVEIVITDVRLPGISGLELLEKIKKEYPWIEVIVITAFADVEDAVEAVKKGAFHYLVKPYEPEVLLNLVKKCAELVSFRKMESSGIVYTSQVMEKVIGQCRVYAKSDAPVLILGESGVGKELVARLIHRESGRKGAFVPVNCAAIPGELFEAELFGYERGAFSGASSAKAGLIEKADKGTLFLDEIGEIPFSLQGKLLRFLQEGEIRRLGSTSFKKVDVRIVAATNRNLVEEVKTGRFREDLFYRLSVLTVVVPPLRQRREDIAVLANYFVQKFNEKYGKRCVLSEEALRKLTDYNFPGNVRELENMILRAVLCVNGEIPATFFDFEEEEKDFWLKRDNETLPEYLERVEKRLIKDTLEKTGYVQTQAARILGIDEKSLRYKRKKYGI